MLCLHDRKKEFKKHKASDLLLHEFTVLSTGIPL